MKEEKSLKLGKGIREQLDTAHAQLYNNFSSETLEELLTKFSGSSFQDSRMFEWRVETKGTELNKYERRKLQIKKTGAN